MAQRRSGTTFEDVLVRIGANIQRLRAAADQTQAVLAETLDISVEHLRGVEGGYRAASLRLLFDATRELGAEIEQLFDPAPKLERNPGRPRGRPRGNGT